MRGIASIPVETRRSEACQLDLESSRLEERIKIANNQGVGLGFGPDVTKRWCDLNKITAVIRSHEVRQDGYAIEHDGLCITTFSCPNYCDTTGNQVSPFYLFFLPLICFCSSPPFSSLTDLEKEKAIREQY